MPQLRRPWCAIHHALPFAILAAALTAGAQEYRGTILGRVTDPSGAAVAGASVEVQNVDTNAVIRASSNETGNYQAPFLLPGEYTVSVQHTGFKTIERKGIRVLTNEPVTVDIALQLGAASESITITAEAPVLNTTNADLGQVVDRSYVGMVSVSLDRNIINFRNLAPGVTGGTGTYTSSAQSTFSIGGGGGTQNGVEVVVDGMPNTTSSGTMGFIPSLDSVEEVKIHSTMFDASYGHSNGGAISIVTKGGTNELHGALYYEKRWTDLNANGWTNNKFGLVNPPTAYHQWGYTVSGPVWIPKLYNGHNRTFFSTSLERDDDPRPLTAQGRVPTDIERKGDFSQTLNSLGGKLTIYDPATTIVSGSTAIRQPFPGAVIPASRISPIGSTILGKLPLPNQSVAPQLSALNWANGSTYTVDQRQVGGRIDHILTDRQRLSGRFGVLDRLQDSKDPFFGIFSYPTNGNTNLGTLFRRRVLGSVDDTMVLSPTLVGSVRLSFLGYSTSSGTGGVGGDPKDLLTPDIIAGNQAIRGYPTYNLGENIPTIGATLSFSREEMYSIISTWTKLTGAHSTKFGVDYRLNRINAVSPGSNASGAFTVTPAFTQQDPYTKSSANTTGTSMATLLLGLADSGNFGYNSATSIENSYTGLFLQDDWKINSRLTINLGVRYELEFPYTERYNRESYRFDPSAALPVQVPGLSLHGGIRFAGVNGNPRAISPDTNNFGPRFGFAWSPLAKTVIRGGFGIFYSTLAVNTTFFGTVGVFNTVTPFIGSIDNNATAANTLANPFPAGLIQPIGSSIGLMAQAGNTLSFFDDRRVNPYNEQWQFDIQRELPSRVLFDIAYTGTHSLKEIESFNLNELPDVYLAQGAAANKAIPNPFLNIFPATSTLGSGATIPQSRLWVQYPQFTTLTVQGANTGAAIYHALQVKADKRLTHGVNLLANYTFSRLMLNNTTSLVNVRHYRAVSALDQKHHINLALTYELPFQFKGGGGANRIAREAFGGWAMSGLLTLAGGMPMTVTQANGRPIRIRNPKLDGSVESRLGDKLDASGHVLNPYFDINAFQPLPNQYTVTPEPPYFDELRAPGIKTLNVALFKSFPIRERLRAEVRLDATGATNTPNFAPPGTNMSQAATFGVITAAGGSRTMQGLFRLVF